MPVDMKKLIQAVRDHSGMENDQIREAGQHGANAGWPGFTYTSDCTAFYEQNKEDVWELLAARADGMGMTPLGLLMHLAECLPVMTHDGLATVLAWFALEETGRWLADSAAEEYDDDDEDEDDDEGEDRS